MYSITASEAQANHIKHWRPPAVYLELYTLQSSLYFIDWEYIYYIIFCVPTWKIKMPSEMNYFSPAYAGTQADKCRRLILKPVAVLTFSTLVRLCRFSDCTVWQHFHILARVVSSAGASWRRVPVATHLASSPVFLQSPPQSFYLRKLLREDGTYSYNCLFSSACWGLNLNTVLNTYPTNHCFNLCLPR